MKKILALCLLSCYVLVTNAQEQNKNSFPKTITVTGSAELEVIPDQVFVDVVLKEYQKRGEDKKDIETIKRNFLTACQQVGLPDSAISISSYTGFNSYYSLRRNKRKNPDLFAGITYQVKFSSSKQMDDLVDKLDDEATQSFDIAYTNHSKMVEFRKQLKIQAVKAAKDKAIYLTQAIDEKLGAAITVKEPEEPSTNRVMPYRTQAITNVSNSYKGESYDKGVDIDFKKIRVRYEVNVVFALE